MKEYFIKPKEGLLVRVVKDGQVLGRHLKPEGEKVAMSKYWNRRIKDGDVIITIENKVHSDSPEGGA